MRKGLLFLLLAPRIFGAFAHDRTVTINDGIISSTLTNYVMTVKGNYTYLKTIANGGQAANGNDIVFGSNAGCSSRIPFQIITYSASSPDVVFYVLISSALASSNTPIHLCFGDASVTTDQSDPHGLWINNYAFVANGIVANDSTSNNLAITNNSATSSAGQVGDGALTSATTWLSASDAALPTTIFSLTGWFCSSTSDTSNIMVNYGTSNAFNNQVYLGYYDLGNGKVAGIVGARNVNVGGSTNLNDGVCHFLAGTYDGTTLSLYIDGSFISSATAVIVIVPGGVLNIGRDFVGTQTFIGVNNAIHIYSVAISAAQVSAEFSNQSNPAAFYTISSDISTGKRTLKPILQ
jgi:hypothetical protein